MQFRGVCSLGLFVCVYFGGRQFLVRIIFVGPTLELGELGELLRVRQFPACPSLK